MSAAALPAAGAAAAAEGSRLPENDDVRRSAPNDSSLSGTDAAEACVQRNHDWCKDPATGSMAQADTLVALHVPRPWHLHGTWLSECWTTGPIAIAGETATGSIAVAVFGLCCCAAVAARATATAAGGPAESCSRAHATHPPPMHEIHLTGRPASQLPAFCLLTAQATASRLTLHGC